MLVKTEAIVLHSFKYGESRLIVDMFTREVGRLSFIVPLPKTPKSRMKKQYPFSPEKLALSLFTAEFLYHALRSEQCNEPLFAYVCDAMRWLDAVETGFANFHLTFLMRLSRFLGFYPNLDDYVDGCVFDLRAATFSLQVPTHRDFLQPDDAQRIHTLMRMDFPTMRLYRLSRHDRNRIVDVLLYYYRLHIPQFPELKSLSVLQELWAD